MIGATEMSAKQLARLAFRVELFQQHGWDAARAQRAAERLHQRDCDRDDRRLCVECANLLSQWRCRARGVVIAEVLQRCTSFDWKKPTQ